MMISRLEYQIAAEPETWNSYDDYLASDVWRSKREERLSMDSYQCQKCGTAKNLRVHHIHYPEVWGSEPLSDLITLCDSCHKRVHAKEKDAKLLSSMRLSNWSSGKSAWRFAFIGFVEGECKKRGLNPRKLENIKQLKTEFANLMGIDEDILGTQDVISYETLNINSKIDQAIRSSTSEGVEHAVAFLESQGITKKHIQKRVERLKEIGEVMQIMNWIEVTPAGAGAEKLPAGAYVIRIVDASDHKARSGGSYVTFVYDIAEGPHANHYASETRDYTHSFNRSYTGNSASFFRSMLDAFESSNPGKFSIEAWQKTSDERAFRGLVIGALFRDRYYTNNSGKDVGPVLDFVRAMPAKDVRDGNWTVPPVKDDRDGSAQPAASSTEDIYGSDLPF